MIIDISLILGITSFAVSGGVAFAKMYKLVFHKAIITAIIDKINVIRKRKGKRLLIVDDDDLDEIEDELIDIAEHVVELVSIK